MGTGFDVPRAHDAEVERQPVAVVIEDDEDIQALVGMVLAREGWTLHPATSVAAGIEATRTLDPDVVLLDLGLPDASGLEVLTGLQSDPRTSWIPVVVLSGDVSPATTSRALHAGAQDFIPKPFAPDELHARLTAALRVSTAHRAVLRSEAAQREAADRLRVAEERYRLTFEDAPIGISLASPDGRFLRVNRVLADILDRTPEELLSMRFPDVTHPDDLEADLTLAAQLNAGELERYQLEKRYLRPDDSPVWVQLSVSLVRDPSGEPLHAVAHVQDITDLKAARELLVHQSFHDPLTGLPNRLLLDDRLTHALARDARTGAGFALLFIDLDRFKSVNDTLGHDAGDALLVEVARRLQAVVRDQDTVARLGGDEFIVLAENMTDEADAADLADRIAESLGRPHTIDDQLVTCSASIGVSFPLPGQSPRELLRVADAAMYRAKERGRVRDPR